jgi:hypothetical protein
MVMFTIPVGLMLVLGGLNLSNLPLSMPPLPPDPAIERAAPDECLLHVSLAGLATPAAGSANHVEALLAEAEVRRFVDEMAGVVEKMLARQEQVAGEAGFNGPLFTADMRSLAFTLLTRPAALTVDSLVLAGPKTDITGSLVVNCGADADKVRGMLERTLAYLLEFENDLAVEEFEDAGSRWSRFAAPPPDAPDIAWGFKDGLFLVAVGGNGPQRLLARLADTDRQPPAWKTALAKRLPLERRSLLAHLDTAKVLDIANTVIRDRDFAPGVAASGVDGLRAVQLLAGLTKTEMASATILDFAGEPAGFFASGQGAVTAADLQAIPAEATMAQVVKLDLSAMLATFFAWMDGVRPGASGQPRQALEQVRAVIGLDVDEHLLKPLGDTWTVYTLPDGGAAAIVELDDAATFAKSHKALLGVARQALARPGMPPLKVDELKEAVADDKAGDLTIFSIGLPGTPLQPAWCIRGDRLLVASSAAGLERIMTRAAGQPSLADVAEVRPLLVDRVAALGYQEPKAAVATLGELYDRLVPLAPDALAGAPAPKRPDAGRMAEHLRPAVSVVRRDAAGDILAEARTTLPLGPFGGGGIASSPAVASIALGMALPAVQAARGAARQTAGMNNLRQIALAMLDHEQDKNGLPAAAICTKDGKPLLSWRVALLPYLGEQELYERFRLDEPWDSEHNKKLVERMPRLYASPGDDAAKPGTTRYLVPTGKGTAFPEPDDALGLHRVTDGMSKTILCVEAEAAKAVPWTKPEDLAVDPKQPHAGLKDARPQGFLAVFIDGHVQVIPKDLAADLLNAMFTRDAND